MARLTKRTESGVAYMAIADTLPKRQQEIEGAKPILEGIYAIFQALADYEDEAERAAGIVTDKDKGVEVITKVVPDDYIDEFIDVYYCGKCNKHLSGCEKYCYECGSKLKWGNEKEVDV